MINNNPYNVPEKPLKQSKVVVQSNPLYPYQINRRQQDIEYKHPPQMMKRSTMPYFLQTSAKQSPRIPLSPQPILKGQHLQVSTVTPWENGKQSSNISIYRELSDRLSQVAQRLDLHQRKISIMMEAKKQEQSTTLSDSTYHSYEISNAFSSKQIQKNLHPQGIAQMNSQIAQMKQEMSSFRNDRERFELRLKKQLKEEMIQQKSLITKQLITNFRESLNQKFAIEQHKINESFQQIMRVQDIKLSNSMRQLKESLSREMKDTIEELKYNEKPKLPLEIMERIELITSSFGEHRSQYLHFKDHVFKNILMIHSQEESLLKLNQKTQLLSKLLQKRQINPYEGHINVSTQRSPHEIIKIHIQSYLNATNQRENAKTKILQVSYCIDTDGFLLDTNGYYILNSKGTKIKIEQTEIRKLKDMGMLK